MNFVVASLTHFTSLTQRPGREEGSLAAWRFKSEPPAMALFFFFCYYYYNSGSCCCCCLCDTSFSACAVLFFFFLLLLAPQGSITRQKFLRGATAASTSSDRCKFRSRFVKVKCKNGVSLLYPTVLHFVHHSGAMLRQPFQLK